MGSAVVDVAHAGGEAAGGVGGDAVVAARWTLDLRNDFRAGLGWKWLAMANTGRIGIGAR